MKKEQGKKEKAIKKIGKKLQIITCTLVIILLALVAIFGVYTQKQNRMVNMLNGYSYGMDLKGARTLILTPSTETSTVVKDSEGKEVEDGSSLTDEEIAEKGYTKEETPDNSSEILNKDNYEKSKEIIEKRLQELGVSNYNVSVNVESGEITLTLPENDETDDIVSNITTVGKFEIADKDTDEILMDNSDIKEAKVLYGSGSSSTTTNNGTMVYLNIKFNKEGKQKFEEVTTNYKTVENTTSENTTTENETSENTTTENTTSDGTESEETQKEIVMKIDDEEMMTTSFDQVVKTGEMSLSIGSSSTDKKTLDEYTSNAQNIATVLNNEKLSVKYNVTKNEYVLSDVTRNVLHGIEIGIIIVVALALIMLIIKYHINGLLGVLAYIGLASIYSIVIRYTNVTVTLEGILGIVITLILNYVFVRMLLKKLEESKKEQVEKPISKATKKTYKEFFLKIMPISIMAVVFTLISYEPISSIGMVSFWGIILIAIYNLLVTTNLLKINNSKSEKL